MEGFKGAQPLCISGPEGAQEIPGGQGAAQAGGIDSGAGRSYAGGADPGGAKVRRERTPEATEPQEGNGGQGAAQAAANPEGAAEPEARGAEDRGEAPGPEATPEATEPQEGSGSRGEAQAAANPEGAAEPEARGAEDRGEAPGPEATPEATEPQEGSEGQGAAQAAANPEGAAEAEGSSAAASGPEDGGEAPGPRGESAAAARLLNALRAPVRSIYHNTQVKTYPDGSIKVLAMQRALMREPGWETPGWGEDQGRSPEPEPQEAPQGPQEAPETPEGEREGERGTPFPESLARAKRRARNAIYDAAMCSDLGLFVTLTIDPAKMDRESPEEVFRHLRYWLDNNVRRRGLAYVLVPEYHKKGGIHFHTLTNDVFERVDSGTLTHQGWSKPRKPRSKKQRAAWLDSGAQVVYNLPGWPFGFTTAIELYGDRRTAVGYLTKYVAKSEKKIGGRWYYSGGALGSPGKFYLDTDFDTMQQVAEAVAASQPRPQPKKRKARQGQAQPPEGGQPQEAQLPAGSFCIPELGITGAQFILEGVEDIGKTLADLRGTARHDERSGGLRAKEL